jgi:hypothetical protein
MILLLLLLPLRRRLYFLYALLLGLTLYRDLRIILLFKGLLANYFSLQTNNLLQCPRRLRL